MLAKTKIKKIIVFISLPILIACEKVVKINVKSTDSNLVVQANINNQNGPFTVKLESSANYYDSNVFSPIKNAKVIITDNFGQSETLNEAQAGIYLTASIQGIENRTYNLKIETNGKVYEAQETMPKQLPIDSFIIRPSIGRRSIQPDGYSITCKFTDPEGLGNFYRIVISSKDSIRLGGRTSRLISDKFADGSQLAATFRTQLLLKDSVSIQLQCITKNIYDFYNTLSNAQGNAGAAQFLSSLPANPTNNISNKGLGYFSVYAVTSLTSVIK